MRSRSALAFVMFQARHLQMFCGFGLALACTRTAPTQGEPDRPKSAQVVQRPAEDPAPAPASRASCGDVVCSGAKPICCAKAGKSWCISEQELLEGACPIDGEHYQLRCGAKADCGGDHCCYFHQMSHCGESCPHWGELCETAEHCGAMEASGNPVQCLADDPNVPFVKSCSEAEALPRNFRLLGQPCDPAKPDGKPTIPGSVTCSQEGRVTGVYQPADFMPAPPDAAVVVSEPKSIVYTTTSFVALDSETIWIRRVTCGECRRILGWSFIGSLPELSPKQLLTLQGALGLDASVPALRSAADWQKQAMQSLIAPR